MSITTKDERKNAKQAIECLILLAKTNPDMLKDELQLQPFLKSFVMAPMMMDFSTVNSVDLFFAQLKNGGIVPRKSWRKLLEYKTHWEKIQETKCEPIKLMEYLFRQENTRSLGQQLFTKQAMVKNFSKKDKDVGHELYKTSESRKVALFTSISKSGKTLSYEAKDIMPTVIVHKSAEANGWFEIKDPNACKSDERFKKFDAESSLSKEVQESKHFKYFLKEAGRKLAKSKKTTSFNEKNAIYYLLIEDCDNNCVKGYVGKTNTSVNSRWRQHTFHANKVVKAALEFKDLPTKPSLVQFALAHAKVKNCNTWLFCINNFDSEAACDQEEADLLWQWDKLFFDPKTGYNCNKPGTKPKVAVVRVITYIIIASLLTWKLKSFV
mmetsp:Transcript_21851/g.53478  ORF Transcript_21851/g.53478 Transcript_21851/m.53478 type:complete len:381 (-) Transcript_21851:122-1264(-)|eukprot:CAMPEP_0114522984 /NCGR_PEP_ID=MMETSP0109-20121206/21044_1 /TAXON_ID=29199 /ORGANISM="Chlorarachnion reptans, Strain CCCM449" /LENGTH=380 /DNA_ID=CAMNT_0001704259 /DNA_START=153 /DNA_END=1295 /DNA_ORIENTATION=-